MGDKGRKLEKQRVAVSPVVTPSRSSASLFSRFLVGGAIASFSLFTPNFSKADENKKPVLVAKADGAKRTPQPPAPMKADETKVAANVPVQAVSTQDSVVNLKTFSLKKLVELDAKTDKEYQRDFWTSEDQSPCTRVKVTGQNGNYLLVIASIDPQTLDKGMSIQYPKDRSNPNGERDTVRVELQTLFVRYVEAGGKSKTPWVKIILNAHDAGVNIFATLVDNQPKSGDSSDLKVGYPLLGVGYVKDGNGVGENRFYFRTDDSAELAQGPTR